jgi:hypothetical protein
MTRFHRIWALLGVAAALALPRLDAQTSEEGPALGVARVSLVNGDVTMRRGDSGDWVQATVNSPLVEGDTIATGQGSRTEVQLDYSNLIRLNENTEVAIASLGNRAYRVQLARGILTYSELRNGEADVDIETPHVAVRPQKNGRYRVEVLGAETVVTVRKGEAQVASPQGTETLKSGRAMIIRGSDDDAEFRIVDADPRDDWDQWNERRDNVLNKSDSYRYMSRSIYGGEDLDHSGHWRYVSGYGYSWFPSVTVGWAPYRHGRWTWLDYYGWTWVSYEPWGWAPYHYGRWYHHTSFGWGWYPGSYHHHHYWRPALVAFFGYSSHGGFSVGAGFGHGYGHVGWIPLGPGEPYYPWYGRHYYGRGRHGGFNNTTIYVDNSVNIYNNYRNARHRNGVTLVDADGFSRGLVNNPRSLRDTELRRATLMRGQIPVVPARESRGQIARASAAGNGSGLVGRNSVRRDGFFNREAGRRTVRSADAGRVPFDQQRDQIQRSIRAYGDDGGRRAVGSNGAAGSTGRVARAGDTNGRSVVRGSVDSVDSGRTRLENRAGSTGDPAGRSGVRGSSPAATGGPASGTRGGVRSSTTESNSGRGGDWRRFGSAGSRSRTPSVDGGSNRSTAPAENNSRSRVDRSSSRTEDRGRAQDAAPSRSNSGNSGASGRSRGGDLGNSGASRVERSPSSNQRQRSAPAQQRSSPPSQQRSAPSRAPSVERSAPRAAPSDGGGARSTRPSRGRERSELRSPGGDTFTRFGSSSSTSARVSRADQGGSPGRFVPRSASRVSSSSRASTSRRGGDSAARASSPGSAVGWSRSRESSSPRTSRATPSRGDFSRSRSSAAMPPSRSSSPRVFSQGGSDRGSRSSGPVFSRSRSAGSAPSGYSRSSGGSISRGGGFSRSSGGGSISRGGSSRGSGGRSSGGGGARSSGRSRGR